MKMVVFTYNRFETITTPAALELAGAEFDVVCHDEDARRNFLNARRVAKKRLIVSGVEKGLANNRNWWIENRLADGEWALMLCDDYIRSTELDAYGTWQGDTLPVNIKNTTQWARRLRHRITIKDFLKRARELAAECERKGVHLGGFAGFDNALFRRNHWGRNVLADGRSLLIKKTALRFPVQAQMVDDVAFSALNIAEWRGVLVNQWVLGYFSRYTQGSFGSIAQRLDQRRRECAWLVERFPGLVVYGSKPGWPEGTHVRIRAMNPDQARAWRVQKKSFSLPSARS